MNLLYQLSSHCAWTVRPLEGGALGANGLCVGRSSSEDTTATNDSVTAAKLKADLATQRPTHTISHILVSLRHETFAKNMAQGPWSAKAHPLSGDQTPSNRINYFQTPSGALRFFSAERVQRPSQQLRGAVILAWWPYYWNSCV